MKQLVKTVFFYDDGSSMELDNTKSYYYEYNPTFPVQNTYTVNVADLPQDSTYVVVK
jgi:hypothetical protein